MNKSEGGLALDRGLRAGLDHSEKQNTRCSRDLEGNPGDSMLHQAQCAFISMVAPPKGGLLVTMRSLCYTTLRKTESPCFHQRPPMVKLSSICVCSADSMYAEAAQNLRLCQLSFGLPGAAYLDPWLTTTWLKCHCGYDAAELEGPRSKGSGLWKLH